MRLIAPIAPIASIASIAAVFLAVGCGGGAAALRVALSGDVDPDTVRMSLYDPHGVVFHDRSLPDRDHAELPGDLVILVAPNAPLRLYARAKHDGDSADGIVRVTSQSGEIPVELKLSTPTWKDRDDDGVPDAIDVCPNVSDPDQTDTDGDGTGDACSGDGGTHDTSSCETGDHTCSLAGGATFKVQCWSGGSGGACCECYASGVLVKTCTPQSASVCSYPMCCPF
jgi:hypothetical protein